MFKNKCLKERGRPSKPGLEQANTSIVPLALQWAIKIGPEADLYFHVPLALFMGYKTREE